MMFLGLDVNATRARAVSGADGVLPQPLALDPSGDEIPLAVSLQNRQMDVGAAGTAILREWPHLVCHDFLAHIGKERTWIAGRHRLDSAKAITLVFERLKPLVASCRAGALVLPAT